MKTVIMAGGRGTRISSVASDIPKPMIKIEGKPVLEHELECLRDQGFKDIILTGFSSRKHHHGTISEMFRRISGNREALRCSY